MNGMNRICSSHHPVNPVHPVSHSSSATQRRGTGQSCHVQVTSCGGRHSRLKAGRGDCDDLMQPGAGPWEYVGNAEVPTAEPPG